MKFRSGTNFFHLHAMKKLLIGFAAFITVVVLFIFFRPSNRVERAFVEEKAVTPVSKFTTWKGAKVHYTDEGEGVPVLMIHGFGGNHRNFSRITDSLKQSFRCIRVDLPGFALSEFPALEHPNFQAEYTDFFRCFFDSLRLDSVYVIGNSMGGLMAWSLAASFPEKVKHLTLVSSAGYEMEKITKSVAAIFRNPILQAAFKRGFPLFMNQRGAESIYFDKTKISAVEVQFNNWFWNAKGNLEHMIALSVAEQYPDTALIKKIQCPTLVIWGKQDKLIPAQHGERFKRDIPNCNLVVLDSCGHVAMMEQPQKTVSLFKKSVALKE